MKSELFRMAVDVLSTPKKNVDQNAHIGAPVRPGLKKVSNKGLSYSSRHHKTWFRPEYDMAEIQIAQDTDSYFFRAVQKKVNRLLSAGYEFVGQNKETLDYVKSRIQEIEFVSGMPFSLLLAQTAQDLERYSNCMWSKVRNKDASSGTIRKIGDKRVQPVAAYFVLPFETLAFKKKANGEIQRVLQRINGGGGEKEFGKHNVIHFYKDKKPGFAVGTPSILPAMDDLLLLRNIEENVEALLESNLYPLFHYKIGSDAYPERYDPEGVKETDIVKNTIDYMPAGGVYISDHRHEIQAIGSEGRAMRIEGYLDYFKKRVFAGLGMSAVDFGEGDTSNRSTAQVLSKSAIQDVEALQMYMKIFIDHFVIAELLLEGGYGMDAFNNKNKVEIKFGVIDKEEKTKEENQSIQLWHGKLITENEARKRLGEAPLTEEQRKNTYFELYEKPLQELNSGPGQPEKSEATGSANQSKSKSRPSNQHGTRPAPKEGSDSLEEFFIKIHPKTVDLDEQIYSDLLNEYISEVKKVLSPDKERLDLKKGNELLNSGNNSGTEDKLNELNKSFSKRIAAVFN